MTVHEIATRLTDLCRKGQFEQAQKELYAEDAVSIEPDENSGFPKETKGLDNIIAKGDRFQSMIEEVHECLVSDPLIGANAIALTLVMDMTMKGRKRAKLEEICVYQVKGGKIVGEHFFY